MPRLNTRSTRRATVFATSTKLVALGLLSAVLVVVPAPRVEAVETMVVDTRVPTLTTAAAAGTSQAATPAAHVVPSGEDITADLADPARRVATEVVEPFDMLGVTVPARPADHLLARVRVGGTWGPWMELELNPEHEAQGAEAIRADRVAPGVHTEPTWAKGADAYELNVPADVASVQVHLIRPEIASIELDAGGATAGAADAPAILSRSQWGARAPKVAPVPAPDLKLAVVHHSVNANTYSQADVPALLRGIQAYHMDTQGWNDIAYNFAVDRFGRIWEARAGGVSNLVVGGHAQGFNTSTTGVMVLGDFTSADPTQASVDAVADIIGWKFARHRQDVRGSTQFSSLGGPRYSEGTVVTLPKIVGHGDVGSTACPGSQLHRRLGEIRTKAASHFDRYVATQPEIPLFGDFDGDGLRDILRYRPGSGVDLLWSRPGSGLRRSTVALGGTYRPAVGDFDGDGRDDVLWYAPGSSPPDRVWFGGTAGFTGRTIDIPEHGYPHVAELDGDRRDDIVIYSAGGGPDRIYSGRADRGFDALPLVLQGIYELSVGDFDGDRRDDLLLYGIGSRPDNIAFSNGRGSFTTLSIAAGGTYVPAVGDFDGNGRDDILWYSPGTGADSVWWSEAGARAAKTVQPLTIDGTTYRPQVGDTNGDGRRDVLMYRPGSSNDPLWSWTSGRTLSSRVLSIGGTFVPDLGRYTADGMDDIAWMSPTSASYLWIATGGNSFRSVTLG